MKHKYRLKSAEKAVLHGFHFGDFSGADQIEEHNQAILNDVFKRIQFGLVDFAYINTGDALGGNLYIISRDTVYSSGVSARCASLAFGGVAPAPLLSF